MFGVRQSCVVRPRPSAGSYVTTCIGLLCRGTGSEVTWGGEAGPVGVLWRGRSEVRGRRAGRCQALWRGGILGVLDRPCTVREHQRRCGLRTPWWGAFPWASAGFGWVGKSPCLLLATQGSPRGTWERAEDSGATEGHLHWWPPGSPGSLGNKTINRQSCQRYKRSFVDITIINTKITN